MTQTPLQRPPVVLAVETSCDETAVAILRDGRLLASEVASQITAHQQYGGVVPEVASRNHLRYAPELIDRAIRDGQVDVDQVDVFAATSGPGLASSLMIGASIAKGLAIAHNKPYLAVNHLEGHLLSPFFPANRNVPQHVGLIVSGGHTLLTFVRRLADYEIIGRTFDDAAGEAYDKVAKLLGLAYPGGPEIERLARTGNPGRFDLPRSMPASLNFSFSGLKTAVKYLLPKVAGRYAEARNDSGLTQTACQFEGEDVADLCASFQQAAIDVLVEKTIAAAKQCQVELVTMSGGVSVNGELRRQMSSGCAAAGLELKTAEPWLCTDNAAMIAYAGMLRFQNGFVSSVEEEINPNLALA